MSLLTKAGITRLSELTIDAAPGKAKDIAELILTTRGDVLYRAIEAARLVAKYGVGYNFLHAQNTGVDEPEWMDIQDIIAYMTGAVNRMIALPSLQIPAPTVGVAVAEDHSGGGHVGEKTLTIPVPTIGKAAASQAGANAVGGAKAYDHGEAVPYTDQTTEANEATADDMTLLPATPAIDDAYYFGYATAWHWLNLNISTAGAGSWTVTWEYWNGSAWVALSGVYDTSNGFRASGMQSVAFVHPGDWVGYDVDGATLYWIRGRVSSYSSVTTQPLGQQAWIGQWS
ncbi:hypothetical protein ES703_50738 [subsurface metagenome]